MTDQEPYFEEDQWTHSCFHCHKLLDDSCPFALCWECQEQASCVHGVPYKEECNRCYMDADFAYDASRGA